MGCLSSMSEQPKWIATRVKDFSSPRKPNTIRIGCFNDSHSTHGKMSTAGFETCDIIMVAGDFSNVGDYETVKSFQEFFSKLPCPHKICIAGNHELSFDEQDREKCFKSLRKFKPEIKMSDMESIKKIITEDPNIIYLECSSVEILGLKIYGTPYSHESGKWAFQARDSDNGKVWESIPDDADIVIVHGPPTGVNDLDAFYFSWGDPELKKRLEEVKPSIVHCGHMHDYYGMKMVDGIMYINASVLNERYELVRSPIIIDVLRNEMK